MEDFLIIWSDKDFPKKGIKLPSDVKKEKVLIKIVLKNLA